MNYKYALGTLVLVTALFSCEIIEKTEDIFEAAESVETVSDYVIANKQFQGVGNAADDAILYTEENWEALNGSGPAITVSPLDFVTFPKNITVDFGDGITGDDGRVRKGKLYILLENGWYKEAGSVHTTTFDNYYQDNYKVEGTHIVTNNGLINNQYSFGVEVINGKITDPSGDIITYSQSSTRTWISGEDTPFNVFDDVYEISGVQNGISRKNVAYTLTTRNDNPILVDLSCQYIKSGILDIDIVGAPSMSIDYNDTDGEPICDSNATLTIGNQEYSIGL